ncbi:hemolysin family protein [Peptoniphilus obesi]|uniref:hemolysin family protein n=1 Tax=Peptoniphilus obesi TaxID=1472765 RepID=UPI0004BBFE41|nr:hemolysin family protein [Peptoniphilus obesi]
MEYNHVLLTILMFSIYLSFEFTMVENALLSLTQHKLNEIKKISEKTYDILIRNYNNDKIYISILTFDYFANALIAVLTSILCFHRFQYLGLILATIISTFFVIIIGEIVPKSIGKQKYEKILLSRAKYLDLLMKLLVPSVKLINAISKLFIRFIGDKNYVEPLITKDELIDAVSISAEQGIIDQEESDMINNLMGFKSSFAKDVMTPRTDIVAIDVESNYDEIIEVVKREAFSRMPVYEDDIDNILGVLHVKDLITLDRDCILKDNLNILKPIYYTYEFKPISQLFNELRNQKLSVAIVNDEYGGTEGIITVEDLVEKIVGSISDEYDEEDDEDYIKISKKKYLIGGSMNLDDFNQKFSTELSSDEIDTIAGYIIENLDRFPKTGENITIKDLNFTIASSKKNRIEKLVLNL